MEASYGKVTDAVHKCALHVRADVTAEAGGEEDRASAQARRRQGTWLLIDEFNRADIDKAIGSLYTVLSSCEPENLKRSPIDLWFETEGRSVRAQLRRAQSKWRRHPTLARAGRQLLGGRSVTVLNLELMP